MNDDSVRNEAEQEPGTVSGRFGALSRGRRFPFSGKKPRIPKGSMPVSFGRCLVIGAIVLFLLAPLGLVRDVVYERAYLYEEATENITQSWGGTQSVRGPALIVPYQIWEDRKEMVTVTVDGKEKSQEVTTREYLVRHKVVLPSDLAFRAVIDPEVRYRGIYRQALFTAPVDVAGSFTLPEATDFHVRMTRIYWDKAWLSLGVPDLKTISEASPPQWDGKALGAYKPGADAGELLGAGFHADVPLRREDAGQVRDFSLHLELRGSGGIYFTPVGERTQIAVSGNWPAPSFQGNLLPVERSIGDAGFSARWDISNLTRSYPQLGDVYGGEFSGRGERSAITAFTAGLDLHEPVSLYRMVRRSVNYGILFIAVTFVALFAFELLGGQRMHLVQYCMVGLSMSLFYLVLLSLAEHVGFGAAFLLASAVTVAMNGLYVGTVLRSRFKGSLLAVLLAALYVVLFSLLRLEDFALLMGTALVLGMMGVLMYVTRSLPAAGEKDPAAAVPAGMGGTGGTGALAASDSSV